MECISEDAFAPGRSCHIASPILLKERGEKKHMDIAALSRKFNRENSMGHWQGPCTQQIEACTLWFSVIMY